MKNDGSSRQCVKPSMEGLWIGIVYVLVTLTGVVYFELYKKIDIFKIIVFLSIGFLCIFCLLYYRMTRLRKFEEDILADLFVLKEENERQGYVINRVFKNSPMIILIVDRDYKIRWVNGFFKDVSSYSQEEVLARDIRDVFRFRHIQLKRIKGRLEREGGLTNANVELMSKTGDELYVLLNMSPVYAEDGSIDQFIAIGVDITEQRNLKSKIRYRDSHDLLTGLPNRAYLGKSVETYINDPLNEKEKLAFLFLNVDNLREINETVGHSGGDSLLIHVAGVLREISERKDVISRLSQNEFGIAIEGVNYKEEIDRIVEEIKGSIETPWNFDGTEFFNSCTIGISIYPDDADNFPDLLKKASLAKESIMDIEKGSYGYYDVEMENGIIYESKIINDLKGAIINRELYMNYQVVYNLKSGCIEGVEALIRWYSPTTGNVSPGDFIPIVENTSMTYEVADFVINETFSQKQRWNEKGIYLNKMAINISAKTFSRIGFAKTIEDNLLKYNLKSSEIILELTESSFAGNVENIEENIKRLRSLGVEIALDDFGTGYSSLSRLRELNIDYIKLDQSFVEDIKADCEDALLIKSVIDLSKELGIFVVAEGIETKEQYDLLKEMECDLIQGYYIERPKSAEELEEILGNYNFCELGWLIEMEGSILHEGA